MKTWKKVLLCICALILIRLIIAIILTIIAENRFKEYSGYCMDSVRAQLGEDIGNINIADRPNTRGLDVYGGRCSYKGVYYKFRCVVYDKYNIKLNLEPLDLEVIEEPEE